jgi:hypothetical protein
MGKMLCGWLVCLLLTAAALAAPTPVPRDSTARPDSTLRLPPKISFTAAVSLKPSPAWRYRPVEPFYPPPKAVQFLVGLAYDNAYWDYERNLRRPIDPRWPPFPDEYHPIGLCRPSSR